MRSLTDFPEMPKLTARQQQILELIQSAIARTGAPPNLVSSLRTPPKNIFRPWRAKVPLSYSAALPGASGCGPTHCVH